MKSLTQVTYEDGMTRTLEWLQKEILKSEHTNPEKGTL
jgi:hypothetical protein